MTGKALTAADISWGPIATTDVQRSTTIGDPRFEIVGEGHYRLRVPECSALFDLDRLYRDRNETYGELVVSCGMAGARTFNGNLFSGNINLSTPWRRRDVATYLKE